MRLPSFVPVSGAISTRPPQIAHRHEKDREATREGHAHDRNRAVLRRAQWPAAAIVCVMIVLVILVIALVMKMLARLVSTARLND